jgi:pyrimidine deaminase RibD-like protein
MLQAIQLSRLCPPSANAFSVGAVITDARGEVIATGYSRKLGPHWHAEEVAIAEAHAKQASLTGAVLYSSLEPCGCRLSGRPSCASQIAAAGITTVYYATPEPPVFIEAPHGADQLRAHGVETIRLPSFDALVNEINAPALRKTGNP